MNRKMLWPALLFVASFFGCKEEIVISNQDALVDPRIAPKVVFTLPPANSVGPYVGWGVYPYERFLFLLRFNKLIDPASAREGFRLTSPLRSILLSVYSVYDDQPHEEFQLSPRDSGYYNFTAPRIGEVLTLSVASPLVDVNGKIMRPGVIGTFLPEPFFRVRRTSPDPDGGLLSPFGSMTLVFNSKVDTSILRYITTRPAASGKWRVDSYDSTVAYVRVSDLPAAPAYTVMVAPGAHDKKGNAMPAPYSVTFQTERFRAMEYSFPPDTLGVYLYRAFYFTFSHPIDTASVRRALRVAPAIPVRLEFYNSSTFGVVPVADYDPLTRYALSIDTSLHAESGIPLEQPVSLSFTTTSFGVSGTAPPDGTVGASVGEDLGIAFTSRLDTATIRKSFTITPAAEGMFFPVQGMPSFTYYFADTLRSYTTYTVTIDTSIRSARGLRLNAPYTYTFTTGKP